MKKTLRKFDRQVDNLTTQIKKVGRKNTKIRNNAEFLKVQQKYFEFETIWEGFYARYIP